jgi:hypothetical protein
MWRIGWSLIIKLRQNKAIFIWGAYTFTASVRSQSTIHGYTWTNL